MLQVLEESVAPVLRQRGMMLALAESCTGGLISDRITNVPGSSDYYLGGVISYSDKAKHNLLHVNLTTLAAYGAVSRQTVIEMARGVRRLFTTEDISVDKIIGLSVSGIAGPGGGTVDKPVGTVWIGLSAPDGDWAWHFTWKGDRLENKRKSAEQALTLLFDYLRGQLPQEL